MPDGGATFRIARAHPAIASSTAEEARLGLVTRQDWTSATSASTLICRWSKVPLTANAIRKPSSIMSRAKSPGTMS